MGIEQDGELGVPVPGNTMSDQEETMNDNDYAALKMHCLNGAQAAADSSRLFAETLRLDHLEHRRSLDQQESVAQRYLQGPHPQYGSPDGK